MGRNILVSPFLNTLWNAMGGRENHRCLLLVLAALTFLPSTVDTVAFDGETALNLLPNYWTGLWFFTYYYLGCYIRVYQPKVRRGCGTGSRGPGCTGIWFPGC